jgi:hypothetical protein
MLLSKTRKVDELTRKLKESAILLTKMSGEQVKLKLADK